MFYGHWQLCYSHDVEEWYDTSYQSKDDKRPLPIDKNKKTINFFKDKFGGKIMKEFVGLRAETYAYLMNDDNEHKNAKGAKKCALKMRIMLKIYKGYLFNDRIILQSQQSFKSDYHNVFTEQTNKIALSSNDDKRLQTFDKITAYPYGASPFKV